MTQAPSSDRARAIVVATILERDGEAAGRAIEAAPAGCALVEIRADHLDPETVAALVRRARREVVVTCRRPQDGGAWRRSEEERRLLLLEALRAGARFVDVEWDGPLADLAQGGDAARVILSHHGARCRTEVLEPLRRAMAATAAGAIKIVPEAHVVADVLAIRELLRAGRPDRRLTSFATGRAGVLSRILAPLWGSWATYGCREPGVEAAAGQLPADELLDQYRVLTLTPATRIHLLVGRAVLGSPSPAMHGAEYERAGIDARYLPLEVPRWADAAALLERAADLSIAGLAVTIPFKEEVARRCGTGDEVARRARAVNTVLFDGTEWRGFNTDGPAARDLVRELGRIEGARVAVVGAGGTGRAAAAALGAAGGRITLFCRTPERARRFAQELGAGLLPLSRLASAEWDVLVQATPLGAQGETVLASAALARGRAVLDVVYGEETPLVRDARRLGLATVDGFRLLVAQAVLQYRLHTGAEPDAARMALAGRRWLARRGIGVRAAHP